MKPTILAALLLPPTFAFASGGGFSDAEIAKCNQYGLMYEAIALRRDQGISPQDSLNTANKFSMISVAEQKTAINTVFFDPGFARAGGPPLAKQMEHVCLYGPPPTYKPLN